MWIWLAAAISPSVAWRSGSPASQVKFACVDLRVEVDSTEYAIGLVHHRFEGWHRTPHRDYPSKEVYRALRAAAPGRRGSTDPLVTRPPDSALRGG